MGQFNPENSKRVVRALKDFGFGSLGLSPEDFMDPESVIQLGNPPNRIDLILGPSGVDFEVCYKSRFDTEVDGIMISFIDLDNLKKNKRASGRMQDLANVENLE